MGLRVRFRVTRRVEVRAPRWVIFTCAAIVAVLVVRLWSNVDYGRYAVTGFFWAKTAGTVTSPRKTYSPIVRFVARDGAVHSFGEDYVQLCGGRSTFCWVRDFDPGQVVPVVYDASAPDRVFIDDWALYDGVFSWFFQAGCALVLGLILALVLAKRPSDDFD